MTDRELLELAARAAGYVIEIDYYGQNHHGLFNTEKCVPPVLWNPLTSDGDALRLATKLEMDLSSWKFYAKASRIPNYASRIEVIGDTTIEVAVRRSIVLVAAEIGRAMP